MKSKNNGDNTFVRITNQMIYDKIQHIEQSLDYLKSNTVNHVQCKENRNLLYKRGFDLKTIIISSLALLASVFALILKLR